jgi:hypothetical protein
VANRLAERPDGHRFGQLLLKTLSVWRYRGLRPYQSSRTAAQPLF